MIHGLGISQSAKWKNAAQNHYGSMCMCPMVSDIKLVTGKVYLHLSSWNIGVVIGKVVRILVITDMFLELSVSIAVGMCLEVFLM